MSKRFDHVAIHIEDLERTVGFYERHFGGKNYFQHTASRGGSQLRF
jgi:catechol 2,3-dioxygenase-like lactoylglutathione lyase family enzyme